LISKCSNLARYDGIREGLSFQAAELDRLYAGNRSELGEEVKRRILMGTYTLSVGYADAYYERALKVKHAL
jgi:aspartyl-tRNA(Asn)/glutamyl-tRNA(Gln) amidotransferase subunit A